MRAPSVLPVDYLDRWSDLARWAVATKHGAAARFAIMFSLTLRWTPVADREHISYVRPRVWCVVAPKGVETQRVSLFEDQLMNDLLVTVEVTANFPFSVFPRTPCGSQSADVWAHSMASRKQDHGRKNFAALSDKFGVALNTWSPLEIYVASLSVFRASFEWMRVHEDTLLSNQLGSHPRRVHYALHWLEVPQGMPKIGALRVEDAETLFIEQDDPASQVSGQPTEKT